MDSIESAEDILAILPDLTIGAWSNRLGGSGVISALERSGEAHRSSLPEPLYLQYNKFIHKIKLNVHVYQMSIFGKINLYST